MLGSPSQRGLTQLALDVLYRSLDGQVLDPNVSVSLLPVLAASEASEAHIIPATTFLEGPKREGSVDRTMSRAQTPMTSGREPSLHATSVGLYPALLGQATGYSTPRQCLQTLHATLSNTPRDTRSAVKPSTATSKNTAAMTSAYHRQALQRLSTLPQIPAIDHITVPVDQNADYAVLVSMYEVYNDRIFDLLAGSESSQAAANNNKGLRRRPLLFKSTEHSPDRKVVAGLRKIVCANLEEALMVLETGLIERRVAGTGSNSISSRSHGFFCLEVQKRPRRAPGHWSKSSLTIVDLAGKSRMRMPSTVTCVDHMDRIGTSTQCQDGGSYSS